MKKTRVIEKHDLIIVSKDELINILNKKIDSVKKEPNHTYYIQTAVETDTWIDENWPLGKDVVREITIRTEFHGN